MAYCLTISVAGNIGGQIKSDKNPCMGLTTGGVPDEFGNITCSSYHAAGEIINLIATPTNSNWFVGQWEASSGTFTSFGSENLSAVFRMPDNDASVIVHFTQEPITLNLKVNGGTGGCIQLNSPAPVSECFESSGSVILPSGTTSVQIYADPDNGYSILKWQINGVDQSGTNSFLTFDIDSYESNTVTVTVFFTESGPCDSHTLTVVVEGNGTVSPGSGDYCDWEILYLNPIPANNSSFSHWEYSGNDMEVIGQQLKVPMNIDRTVTAVFIIDVVVTELESKLFYCSSGSIESNVISFSYTNDSLSDVTRHFRLTFYSDYDKLNTIYSTFSYISQKRWFYNDGTYVRRINSSGVTIPAGQTYIIVFDPEIIPKEISETQKKESVDDSTNEIPLNCGIKYYINIEEYNVSTYNITSLTSQTFILNCENVDSFYWDEDKDKNNWICSGQGKDDLKVSSNGDQSLFPDVCSDIFGIFQISWQNRINSKSYIYRAMWLSDDDILYSSGQGLYDQQIIKTEAFRPIGIVDQSSNFYTTGYKSDDILFNACPISVTEGEGTPFIQPEVGVQTCYPGYNVELSSSRGEFNIRVYEKDQDGSIVINKDKVLPVVTKTNLKFDICGIDGAYAVRLRESSDSSWGDWINIDNQLYYSSGSPGAGTDDIKYDAYRIDNDRFIVPYDVKRINGIRRICCQILTLYGISRTFCIEIFMNMSSLEYVFEFYKGDATVFDETTKMPTYNGMYVLGKGSAQFLAIFNENLFTNSGDKYYYNQEEVETGDFKFNVIQQGIDDIWGGDLTVVDTKTLKGSFTVYGDDGVFNKDGKGFIQIIFPDSISTNTCLSDISDIYNLMINSSDAERYQNLKPEDIYQEYKANNINKALNIVEFQQYYNKDDENFRFGNSKYYRND